MKTSLNGAARKLDWKDKASDFGSEENPLGLSNRVGATTDYNTFSKFLSLGI